MSTRTGAHRASSERAKYAVFCSESRRHSGSNATGRRRRRRAQRDPSMPASAPALVQLPRSITLLDPIDQGTKSFSTDCLQVVELADPTGDSFRGVWALRDDHGE